MSRVHDNGRVGESSEPDAPDLFDLIDRAGALLAGVTALTQEVDAAAIDAEGIEAVTYRALAFVANDAREARWYLHRGLLQLRSLLD